MRVASLLVLISGAVVSAADGPIRLPPEVQSGKWRMLDKSPRARTVASWWTVPVTEAEYRKMRQHYRQGDFYVWAKRLRQLRRGMTQKEITQILQPKEVGPSVTGGGMVFTTIVLNDAYFADVQVDPYSNRMLDVTPPLAMTYEIKPKGKKPPRT